MRSEYYARRYDVGPGWGKLRETTLDDAARQALLASLARIGARLGIKPKAIAALVDQVDAEITQARVRHSQSR